jgi:micrococcal nuclease
MRAVGVAASLLLLAAPALAVRVALVYDGDTFLTSDSQRVRLMAVDAPESYQPGGDISRDMLERLLAGRDVRLEADRQDRDDFGRLLRYVWLGDTCVNLELAARGYVCVRMFQDTLKYRDTLLAVEESAARTGRGLWSFNVFQPPTLEILKARIAAESVAQDSSRPGVPLVSWIDAGRHEGRLVTVQGFVVASYNSGKVCLLNFHQDYRKYFKVAMFSQDFGKFPPRPQDYYVKRNVRVTGIVKMYNGAPEIIVNDPGQIEILPE